MNSMSRRGFLGNTLAFSAAQAMAKPRQKLNFLFILLDDMGWTDLHCYGSDFYETPNIDRLAAQGMRFTNGYAACPVCSPSRAAILTGKYPARLHLTDWIPGRKQWPAAKLLTPSFRQHLPLEEVTIAEGLKPAGYASASMGKWHLGDPPYYPEKQGFDLNVAGSFRGHAASYFGPFDLPNLEGGTRQDYITDCLTDRAEKFIEQNKDHPFFLYLAEFAVHLPLQAKQPMIEKYKARIRQGLKHRNAIYAAMIESVDEAVGRLTRKLEELKIADRTVIVYTSDNGGVIYEGRSKTPVTSNAPLRAGKGHVYEGGIRVPLIVRWPGVTKPGSVCETPACGVDFFPTLTEMAGRPAPRKGSIDGKSIVPLLKQRGSWNRDALYWHYPHYSNQGGVPAGAVRMGHYKLIEFYEDGRLELYDLSEDPGERKNLVRILTKETARLHEMLRHWRTSVNASMPTPNPNYDPAKADQGLTGAESPTPPI